MGERKGFTLIELIAVVVILGIIALIAVPAVTSYLSGSQMSSYKIAEQNLAEAAYNMFTDCAGVGESDACRQYSVPDPNSYVTVPLSVLVDNGFLNPIEDPKNQGTYCDQDKSFAIIMNDATDTDFNAKLSYKACLYCEGYQSTDCNFEADPTDRIENPSDFTVNQCENFESFLEENGIDLHGKVYLHGEDVAREILPSPTTIDTKVAGPAELKYSYAGLSATTTVTVQDITPPSITTVDMRVNGNPYNGRSWTGSNVVVSFSATDVTNCGGTTVAGIGVKGFMYSKDNGSSWTTVTSGYTETGTFNGDILVKAIDKHGNEGPVTTYHMMVDKTPPQMTNVKLTLSETGGGYTSGATTYQDVIIEPSGMDEHSGFQKFIYSTDGGNTYKDVPDPFIMSSNMNTDFWIKAVDKVGNRSTNTVKFTIRINKNFTVTYNANGGYVSPSSKTVTYGSTYGTLATPTRTGYTFQGWYTASTGGTRVTSTTKVTQHQNHTIYARWDANDYTVTFDGNSGTTSFTSKTVTYDSTYGSLPTASKNGYTFQGWYTSISGGTLVTSSTKVTTASNHTLYARWHANTYTLYYDANGGSVSPTSKNVTYDETYGILARPSRSGYTFQGWYTSRSGGSQVTSTTKVTSTGNHTIYAHWQVNSYQVTFNGNGGTPSYSNKTVTYDSSYGNLPTASYTGHDFLGWYTSINGGSQVTSSTIVKTASNHTLYARWNAKSYTVTFQANGGSVSPTSKTVTYGSTYGTLPTPSRTGYVFAGWYDASSGGQYVSSSTTVNKASNHTLYARWTARQITVNYDANGGSVSPSYKNVTYDGTYGTLARPTRNGYAFDGWYTSSSGGSLVSSSTKVTNSSTHTIYAHWSVNSYQVTYDANGGSVSPTSKSVTYGSSYGTLATPSRSGYTFLGWFTGISTGSQVTASTTVTNASNHTIYARWRANTYTVTYNANGGSVSPASKNVTFGNTYGTLARPTKTGYTFDGWYTSATGGTLVTSSTQVTTSANHTIYAHWSSDAYTVTFDATGGSVYQTSKSVTYGSTYGSLPTPTKTGYRFTGWYTSISGGTKIESTTTVTTIGSHTLYAHWTGNTYIVNLDPNGGTVSTSFKMITYNSLYGTLPKPSRSGYDFLGWFTEKDGGTEVTSATRMTTSKNHTLYAHWSVDSYKVSFNANGGTVSPTSKSVTYGSPYGALPTPTKEGYQFQGWYDGFSGGDLVTSSTIVSATKDHTLYARWDTSVYTVSFDANGGTVNTPFKTIAYGNMYGTLPTPTRTGYKFLGWFTSKTGGTVVTSSTKVTTTQSHTVYAHWQSYTYTVTYDANGGSVSPASKNVTYGDTYGTLAKPTRDGYDFAGWYTAASGGTKITSSTKVTATSNHKIYAHWIDNSYTVTFDANGGSVSPTSKTVISAEPYGTLPTPTRSGYTFVGWFWHVGSNGGAIITPDTKVTATSDHTLVAHWSLSAFTLSFNGNGGSSPASRTVNAGAAYGTLPTSSRTGYDFVGWFTAASGGTQVSANTKMGNANTTLYAHWNKKYYTLSFDSNGGSAVGSRSVGYGDAYGTLPTPTRQGYFFEGWYTSASGGTRVWEPTTMGAGNVTVYAHWGPVGDTGPFSFSYGLQQTNWTSHPNYGDYGFFTFYTSANAGDWSNYPYIHLSYCYVNDTINDGGGDHAMRVEGSHDLANWSVLYEYLTDTRGGNGGRNRKTDVVVINNSAGYKYFRITYSQISYHNSGATVGARGMLVGSASSATPGSLVRQDQAACEAWKEVG